ENLRRTAAHARRGNAIGIMPMSRHAPNGTNDKPAVPSVAFSARSAQLCAARKALNQVPIAELYRAPYSRPRRRLRLVEFLEQKFADCLLVCRDAKKMLRGRGGHHRCGSA